jgi:nucleoid-associated protein YgaU
MPGPEWTNDEPGNRDHSPPLNGPEVAPSYPFPPVAKSDQAHAQPPEPAMAHVQNTSDQDQDETEATETPARPRKPSGTPLKFLALLKKIPLPSLGSERHERPSPVKKSLSDLPPTETPSKSRAHSKFPLLHMKRETRVGLAALLSFAVLVTATVVKRGWKSTTPLAIANPDNPETRPNKDEPKKEEPKKEEPKKEEPKREEPKREEPKPATKTGEGTSSPEIPPNPTNLTPVLAGNDKPKEPETPPKTEGASGSLPPIVPDTPATAVSLPELASSIKPDLPPVVTTETIPLPTVTGPTSPAPALAPEPTPPPKPVTAPAPIPAPTPPPDLPAVPDETKPSLPELNPAPATPPAGETALPEIPASTPPPIPTPQPPPVVPEPLANPGTSLNNPSVTTPTAPVPAEKTPTLEEVPPPQPTPPATSATAPIEPAATATSMGGSTIGASTAAVSSAALGTGWVVIQSGGRRIPGTAPIVSTPSVGEVGQTTPSRVADGPRPSDDLAADQIEPVFHKVKPGENFWTISKLFYNSGRYYKALHAANEKQVPEITKLYVGTVLTIPPPEKLDRALIERETAPVTRTTKKADPTDLADLAPPVRPRTTRPDPEIAEAPRRPTYRVKPRDTLRKIARETLNDSTRDKEIFDLNRDVLDDPKEQLTAGITLVLPEDASVGRIAK